MTSPSSPDLGALLNALLVTVVAREEPLLARRDLSMWDYVILTALADHPAPTQARLAEITGRDTTRLIAHLTRLEEAGLLTRVADENDRRNRIVRLTTRGTKVWAATRADIRAMEDDLLQGLPERRRAAWRRDLATLAAAASTDG